VSIRSRLSALPPDHLLVQASKFLGTGIIAALLDYMLYVGLVALFAWSPTVSKGAGLLVGTTFSYVLNVRWTFQADSNPRIFGRFWFVTLTGGALSVVAVHVLVGIGIDYRLAGLLAVGGAAVFNFTLHRLWTFNAPANAAQTTSEEPS